MKTFHAFLLGAAVLAAAGSGVRAQTPVRITADRVNLRAKPKLTAEVVAQANYDDRLVAREIGEEWVEVAAPASVDLWVSKAFVRQPENTIAARRVNVRAGPSINYNIVDTLDRDTVVELREDQGEWLKIAPPSSAHVWVHRDYVELPGEAATSQSEAIAEAPATEPAPAPAAVPAVPAAAPSATPAPPPTPLVSPSVPEKDAAVREIPVPPPADLKLIPLQGQGRLAEFEGELRAAPLINEAPTRYRIVRWQSNRWQILCHVYGKAAKLRSLQDKRVRVKGREYWIQGAAAPVLVPDQIQEVTGE